MWRAKSKTVLPPKQYPMAAIRVGSTPATRNVADEWSGTVISSCLLQLPALRPRLASSKNWVHCYSPKCPLSWGKPMITHWNRMASHFQTNPNSPKHGTRRETLRILRIGKCLKVCSESFSPFSTQRSIIERLSRFAIPLWPQVNHSSAFGTPTSDLHAMF